MDSGGPADEAGLHPPGCSELAEAEPEHKPLGVGEAGDLAIIGRRLDAAHTAISRGHRHAGARAVQAAIDLVSGLLPCGFGPIGRPRMIAEADTIASAVGDGSHLNQPYAMAGRENGGNAAMAGGGPDAAMAMGPMRSERENGAPENQPSEAAGAKKRAPRRDHGTRRWKEPLKGSVADRAIRLAEEDPTLSLKQMARRIGCAKPTLIAALTRWAPEVHRRAAAAGINQQHAFNRARMSKVSEDHQELALIQPRKLVRMKDPEPAEEATVITIARPLTAAEQAQTKTGRAGSLTGYLSNAEFEAIRNAARQRLKAREDANSAEIQAAVAKMAPGAELRDGVEQARAAYKRLGWAHREAHRLKRLERDDPDAFAAHQRQRQGEDADAVAAWLAEHQPTRCPPAAVAPTQAEFAPTKRELRETVGQRKLAAHRPGRAGARALSKAGRRKEAL